MSKHFTLKELMHSDTSVAKGIRNAATYEEIEKLNALADNVLEPARELLGVPMSITSGFRCVSLNAQLGGAKHSQHRFGEAADFIPKGLVVLDAARKIARSRINFDQLIYEERLKDGILMIWIHISYSRASNRGEVLHKIDGQPYRIGLTKVETS